MTRGPDLSRRRLLRDLGIAGIATGGLAFVTTGDAVAYQQASTFQTDAAVDVLVEWRETYNGAVLETGATDPDPTAPLISLTDVQPGDEGVLAFRVSVAAAAEPEQTVSLVMDAAITDEAENGITEPERAAGDDTSDGELADHVRAEVWYDAGLFGGCNGTLEPGNPILAEGSLREVAGAISADPLANPGGDGDCFGLEDSVCLGLHWWLPTGGEEVNVYQSDGATFDLSFGAVQC
ncbi:MAG: hypothetical protein ABEJ76_07885 [Halanaeroarchaeum sp.]